LAFEKLEGTNMSRIAILFAGALAVVPMNTAHAQSRDFNNEQLRYSFNEAEVRRRCRGSAAACGTAVAGQIGAVQNFARRGLITPLQRDALLGEMAAIIQSLQTSPPSGLTSIVGRNNAAGALRSIAAAVSDPVQSSAITQAATQVEAGGSAVEIPLPAPSFASPS
jgi:hypothetical protein